MKRGERSQSSHHNLIRSTFEVVSIAHKKGASSHTRATYAHAHTLLQVRTITFVNAQPRMEFDFDSSSAE